MLISVITINYNNKKGLKKTLNSVLNQTFKSLEYIVIDGGSTDGSLEEIKKNVSQLSYWISEPDAGIYNAMNKGIKKAEGDYLLFLNSGDVLNSKEVLQDNIKYLDGTELVYFNLNVKSTTSAFIKKYPKDLTFSYLVKDSLPHPATLIHKKLFKKVGLYDESLNIVSDWKFFIVSLCKYKATYKYINQVISTFYLDGISSHAENNKLLQKERAYVLKTEFQTFLSDINELNILRKTIKNLKASKKLKWLIKLGFINKIG